MFLTNKSLLNKVDHKMNTILAPGESQEHINKNCSASFEAVTGNSGPSS